MFTFENYSAKAFVDYVVEQMKLKDSNPDVKAKIEKEILTTLGRRIIASVVNAMTEENLVKFDIIKATHPEFSDYEAIFALIDEIPLLHEIMIKNVNDLAQELIYDVNRLDEALEKSKSKK
ncbi:hypothetical protein C0416_05505 [bacterium]|nr:hypothetical protein [bacterium]